MHSHFKDGTRLSTGFLPGWVAACYPEGGYIDLAERGYPGEEYLPVIETPFDPATHVAEGLARAGDEDVRQVRALTAEELAARAPRRRLLSKLEFKSLVVGVVGAEAWAAARQDPLLFDANDTLNIASVVDPRDMPAFFAACVQLGHMTQAQVDAIMTAWPVA